MNVALSNYKLQSNNDALEALDNVLKHHNNHVKALFIKGKILFHIGELTEAIKCFKKALEFEDNAVS
jgi:tetratricopeptide (TPR) repeat protein